MRVSKEMNDMGLFKSKEEREKKHMEKMAAAKELLKDALYETALKEDKSFSAGRVALAVRKDVPPEYVKEALDALVKEGRAEIDGTDRFGQPTYRKVVKR